MNYFRSYSTLLTLIVVSTTIFFLGCTNSIHVKKSDGFQQPKRTLFNYVLPKTVIQIKIPIQTTTKKPSPFLKHFKNNKEEYQKFLMAQTYVPIGRLNDSAEAPSYQVKTDAILISPIAVPDENKRFVAKYSCSPFKKAEASFSLNKEGMITTGNYAQSDILVETTVKLSEFALSLVTEKVTKGTSLFAKSNENKFDELFKSLELESKGIPVDLMPSISKYNKLLKVKSEIYQKSDYKDLEILKYQEKQVDNQIKALENLLFGKTSTSIRWVTFAYDPKKEDFEGYKPKQFDLISQSKKGVSFNENEVVGETPVKTDKDYKKLTLILSKPDASYYSNLIDSKDQNIQDKKTGFYYNIPAKLNLQLKFGETYLTFKNKSDDKEGTQSQSIYVAQLGTVGYLPKNMSKIDFEFYEDLGSLKSLSITKDIYLTQDRMDAGLGTLDSLRTTYKLIRDSKKENDDEDVEIEGGSAIIPLK